MSCWMHPGDGSVRRDIAPIGGQSASNDAWTLPTEPLADWLRSGSPVSQGC